MTTAPTLARTGAALSAAAHPAITPRLVVPGSTDTPLGLAAERDLGTYLPGPHGADPTVLLDTLEAAGLRGRGGAAFPAHLKWRGVAAGQGPRVAVANGEEGEPASAKDRWLLTHRPHLVLDGLLLAARTVGADRAIVYLSHPDTVQAVRAALDELTADGDDRAADVEIRTVEPTYVAGEESAVCRFLSGGPALPTAKPPRPHESGVDGRPTLVSNVETLAHAAWIARHGAAAYRAEGTDASPGTTLVTLSGACAEPGVYEVPLGRTVGQLFDEVGGGLADGVHGVLMGGWFGGMLRRDHLATGCCYDTLRAVGSGLGCGAITALGTDDTPLRVAAELSAWYARESAAQCGVCVNGTKAIRDTFARLADGAGTADDRDRLARWGQSLPRRGACAFLDGAATLARSAVAEYPEAFPASP
ncbi:NADH-quinone oxidoreductase subunit 1 [Streptomyces sp. RB17]|uniref:NADH-ubiquinone oxidoreductase-F iron-sulfur binding region domain-containing protein n=1 Tax=Streptomyces sp. RB17 TaxID=2585197 RepID=UPI001297C50B|nr:NADH-ubiquinone oxidoreductase-F iron-sulfur binding region domain-containing protein [Streptomyces sp. RB17]MQY33831.1 NADH-quinone oxidoreductase subunit 1 [Streptomyces sp. RB17]